MKPEEVSVFPVGGKNEAQELCSGDVVMIPAGVKHWHGAAPDRA